MSKIKTLIVDEDVGFRDLIRRALESFTDIEIIGAAPTAKIGLDKIKQTQPGIVIASESLKTQTIVQFTQDALQLSPDLGIIITVSKDDTQSAVRVIESLGTGAFDFIIKPGPGSGDEDKIAVLKRLLISKIRCHSIKRFSQLAKAASKERLQNTDQSTSTNSGASNSANGQNGMQKNLNSIIYSPKAKRKFDIVVIGVSTGGPEALLKVIPEIPDFFPLPIVIVLHMPRNFTGPMAESLNNQSKLTVLEAQDKMYIEKGKVYLAQGGRHLKIDHDQHGTPMLCIVDSPPVNGCRPAVDILFNTAAKEFHSRVLGVIMTGMGTDGTQGSETLKKELATVIVQDKESSVVWGMPGSVVSAGCADKVLPLNQIAGQIIKIVTES